MFHPQTLLKGHGHVPMFHPMEFPVSLGWWNQEVGTWCKSISFIDWSTTYDLQEMAGPVGTGCSVLRAVRRTREALEGGEHRARPQRDCSREENSLMWSWETKGRLFPLPMASQLSLMTSGNDFRILSFNFHGTPEWPDNKYFFTRVAWIGSLFLAISWPPIGFHFTNVGSVAVSSRVQVLSLLRLLAQCLILGR